MQMRTGEGSTQYQTTLTVPLAGHDAKKNKANKHQLSQLLFTHDNGSNIELVDVELSIINLQIMILSIIWIWL